MATELTGSGNCTAFETISSFPPWLDVSTNFLLHPFLFLNVYDEQSSSCSWNTTVFDVNSICSGRFCLFQWKLNRKLKRVCRVCITGNEVFSYVQVQVHHTVDFCRKCVTKDEEDRPGKLKRLLSTGYQILQKNNSRFLTVLLLLRSHNSLMNSLLLILINFNLTVRPPRNKKKSTETNSSDVSGYFSRVI